MNLSKKAFTLVEMLIVVVIIGILIAALVPRLTGAQAKARDVARKADLSQVNTALTTYFNDEGIYTGNGCLDDIKSDLVPKYMASMPRDPQATRQVLYGNNGTTNVCTKGGSYGAMAIVNNGGDAAGMLLMANTETEGKGSNFVLAQSLNTNVKDKAVGVGLDAGTCDGASDTNLVCFKPDVERTTLEPNLCRDGVYLNGGAASAGCDTAAKGTAKVNAAMVYIVP